MTIHWDKKPLKEVATIIGGSTPKTNINEFWGGNQFWVAPAELNGNKYISSTVKTITEQAVKKTHLTLLPTGTVLLSSRAPIGKVAITTVPMYCNQGFKNVVCGEYLHNEYVYYYLKHNINYLQSLGTGATFKEISKKVVEDILIPVPPINIQKEIASELDLLSSIIEKKNEQLKILDKLAESIFYEIFGDSISNEKGWPVNNLGTLCNSELGKMLDSKRAKGTNKPYLCTINVLWDKIDLSTVKEMPFEDEELERYSIKKGDLLICEGGDTGRAAIWDRDDTIYYQNSIHRVRFDKEKMLPQYFLYILKLYKQQGVLNNYSSGQTIKHLVKKSLLSIPVPTPPIEIQHVFAQKLDIIKRNRHIIECSLRDAQQLLASRMDKYFSE